MDLKQITERLDELTARAESLATQAEAAPQDAKSFRETLENDVLPEIEKLREARIAAEREEEIKSMRTKITSLDEVIEELRKPIGPFHIGTGAKAPASDSNPYAQGHSFYADIKAANKGRQEAIERITSASGHEGKAMTEGVDAQGGYLVQPAVERQIIERREQDNAMRALCSVLNVNTVEIRLDQLSLGTTAGWVAELAEKPESTSLSLASVSASVFTAAGLATISNQLLADSNPAVDGLVTADLAKRLVALEEAAFLDGTGVGQPLGLLRTPGLQTQEATLSADPGEEGALLDMILEAIAKVQTEHGEPTAILMHPRTWVSIIRSRNAQGLYWLGNRTADQGPATNKSLLGYTVVTSNRVPTNLGPTGDQSRVIVGDFSEALILDRQGITVDESPHVYFTSNQTVFRAEQRVGFTAARQPKAFCVVGGAGLAGR